MSTQLYARVFTQILDSSLADDWQTRHVFEDLLKLADDGVVDMTHSAIARRTNIPLDVVCTAIKRLEEPDPASRDPSEQGRRLIRLDDHRDWGWFIANFEKYESIKCSAEQRDRARERKRRQRERVGAPSPCIPSPTASATATATEGVGHSVTPCDMSQPERDISVTSKKEAQPQTKKNSFLSIYNEEVLKP